MEPSARLFLRRAMSWQQTHASPPRQQTPSVLFRSDPATPAAQRRSDALLDAADAAYDERQRNQRARGGRAHAKACAATIQAALDVPAVRVTRRLGRQVQGAATDACADERHSCGRVDEAPGCAGE